MLHEMVQNVPMGMTDVGDRAPLRARLKREKEFLQSRLDKVERALTMLEGDRDMAEFLELLEQVQ